MRFGGRVGGMEVKERKERRGEIRGGGEEKRRGEERDK